ncbi:MAG: Ig-like domain-containing protein [Lachnospiraceae bacterium]|nr:Ig-like domain-containing protein [Lachnospiraceae bacterium]
MREYLKKRLAVFLTIMMVLPAIVAMLPMTATEVSAASNVSMDWIWKSSNSENLPMQVEKGQKFYIGDYANVYVSSDYKIASMVKASYSSSKSSVATVDKNGYLTAKGIGKATITIKYKGKKLTTQLEVVPAGTFGKSKAITGLKKQAKNLAKKAASKVTVKNGFAMAKAMTDYRKYASDVYSEISYGGLLREKVTKTNTYVWNGVTHTYTSTYTTETNKIAVPQAGRFYYLSTMLSDYGRKNSPTATNPAKKVKIASASATTGTITLKLKAKISAEQVLGARIFGSDEWNKKANSKKAYCYASIYDAETNEYYSSGKVEFKKGSNIVKITPMQDTYVNGAIKYSKIKLEKGKTYRIGSKSEWAKGKTVKVK